MEIKLVTDVRGAQAKLKNFQKRRVPALTVSALNKTLNGAFTDTKKVMSKKIGMIQGEVGRRLGLEKAIRERPIATLWVRGEKRVPNLIRFKAKAGPKPKRKGKKGVITPSRYGVSAHVWEARKVYKGTWIWKRSIAGAGGGTVFKNDYSEAKRIPKKGSYVGRTIKRGPRKGQAITRQPIAPVYGTSLRRAFLQRPKQGQPAKAILKPMIEARWREEFARQLKRL